MTAEELQEICNKLKLALPKSTVNPVLASICIRGGKIMAFDGVTGVITKIDTDINICVPGTQFVDQIAKLDGEVDLSLKGEKLLLTCGAFKAQFKTCSHLDFPDFVPQDRSELISGEDNLTAALSAVIPFAGTESDALGGLCLVSNKIYASDGRTATKALLSKNLTDMIHVPERFVRCVLKFGQPKLLFRANAMVGAYYAEGSVVITRQIVPRFPHEQVDGVFQVPEPDVVLPEALDGVLKRISASLDDSGDLTLESDQAQLLVSTQSAAEGLAWTGPKFKATIGAKRLMAALKLSRSVRVGSDRALLFTGKINPEDQETNIYHAVGLSA